VENWCPIRSRYSRGLASLKHGLVVGPATRRTTAPAHNVDVLLVGGVSKHVLGAPRSILDPTFRLLRGAFDLSPCVSSDFANGFLDGAFRLLSRACDTILVRSNPLQGVRAAAMISCALTLAAATSAGAA
jgi:hypothetical protein